MARLYSQLSERKHQATQAELQRDALQREVVEEVVEEGSHDEQPREVAEEVAEISRRGR